MVAAAAAAVRNAARPALWPSSANDQPRAGRSNRTILVLGESILVSPGASRSTGTVGGAFIPTTSRLLGVVVLALGCHEYHQDLLTAMDLFFRHVLSPLVHFLYSMTFLVRVVYEPLAVFYNWWVAVSKTATAPYESRYAKRGQRGRRRRNSRTP